MKKVWFAVHQFSRDTADQRRSCMSNAIQIGGKYTKRGKILCTSLRKLWLLTARISAQSKVVKCVKWGPYTPNVWSGDLIHQMCEVGTLYTKCVKLGPYKPNVWSWDLIHQMCELGTLHTKCVKLGPYTPNVWSGDLIHQMCEVGTL